MKEIIIKDCFHCPFFYENKETGEFKCDIDSGGNEIPKAGLTPITPKWCPLRENPILIKLEHCYERGENGYI